jgi:hypothetical protein
MSPLLQEFYDECYKAINDHPPYWFSFGGGLCWNLIHFLDHKKSNKHSELRSELMDQFYYAELDLFNPFNPSKVDFYNEINKYSNLLRVQWIKDHRSKPNV